MPNYPWLFTDTTDTEVLPRKIEVQRQLGVPFPEMSKEQIRQLVASQAKGIADDVKNAGAEVAPDREIVALIAYLQKLGKSEPVSAVQPEAAKTAAATK